MTYACFTFDDETNHAIHDAATRISATSAFAPATAPFHVPLHGSLHSYSQEDVFAVFAAVPEGKLGGKFTKWVIEASQLRAVVELTDAAVALLTYLQTALPKGKAWRSFYVTLGSVETIEETLHGAFLSAVEAAFPIHASATFRIQRLELHGAPDKNEQKTNGPIDKSVEGTAERMDVARPQKALDATATAFVPSRPAPAAPSLSPAPLNRRSTGNMKKRHRKKKQQALASPHLTWDHALSEELMSTGHSTIDDLIKNASIGSTGRRAAKLVRSGAAKRAAAVGKARQAHAQGDQ